MQEPENNPYAAPEANLGGRESYGESDGSIPAGIAYQLARTKGYTRFTSILAFVFGGVMVYVALERAGKSYRTPSGTDFRTFMVILFSVMALLALLFGLFLWRFSSASARAVRTRVMDDLEGAMFAKRNFWIFWGIVSLLSVAFDLLALFGAFRS